MATHWLWYVVVGGVSYFSAFPLAKRLIASVSARFRNYKDARKEYILANLLKSIVLSGLTGLAFYAFAYGTLSLNAATFVPIAFEEMSRFDRFACISSIVTYMITDAVPMLRDRSLMQTSTIAHHVAVNVAGAYMLQVSDFGKLGPHWGFFYYGLFSSGAFLVNWYLGARFLPKILDDRREYAAASYIIACAVNWTWQCRYVTRLLRAGFAKPPLLGYALLLAVWINDDVKLIKHLLKVDDRKRPPSPIVGIVEDDDGDEDDESPPPVGEVTING